MPWKNKQAEKAYRQAYSKKRREDPEFLRQEANYSFKRRFGITLEQRDAMIAEQGGACLICEEVHDQALCVDHDHSSGEIRGMLCQHCNRTLGAFGDNPERFEAAARYLRK